MLSLSFSAGMLGIEGYVVRVEANSSAGSPNLAIIGLPDRALTDARERVRAAIANSGFSYPAGRLLVNLSPADVRKEGPAFDLAIALALMAIDQPMDRDALQSLLALGELALDGSLRPVSGILPMVLGARNAGFARLIVPAGNAEEAALVDGIELYAVDSLQSAVAVVDGNGAKWRRRTTAPNLFHARIGSTAILPTCADRSRPNARSKSRRRVGTIFCSWDPRAAERRCSRGGYPRFCRRCRSAKRST